MRTWMLVLLMIAVSSCSWLDAPDRRVVTVYVSEDPLYDPFRPVMAFDTSTAAGATGPGMGIGATRRLYAVGVARDSALVRRRPDSWTSSDPAIATISDSGVVLVRGKGSVTFTATMDGISGSRDYQLPICPLYSAVVPSSATIAVGERTTFTAWPLGVPGCEDAVTWSTSNTRVATIDSLGVATGVGPGQTTIIATLRSNRNVRGAGVLTVR